MSVTLVFLPPFASGPSATRRFLAGASLADMIAAMPLPEDFAEHGRIAISKDGEDLHDVPAALWPRVRLKAGTQALLSYELRGGEGNGAQKGMMVLGLVLALATAGASAWITAGGLVGGASGSIFSAGAWGAKLLAGAVTLAGGLARAALSKPPASETAKDDQRGPASVSGNVLGAGAPVPRVIGTRRIYPPLACQPLTERIGPDEIAEAVYVLAGPHKLEDIRLGDTPILEAEDVEHEVREGWESDAAIGLVTRHAQTKAPQVEMSRHALSPDSDDGRALANQDFPERSLPKWHAVSAKLRHEVWLHFTAPEGLYDRDNSTKRQVIPLRIRMRKESADPWINLPELHYASKETAEVRISVCLKRTPALEVTPACTRGNGFVAAFKAVAGQETPPSDAWAADAGFSEGAGNDGLYSGVEAASNVRRVALQADQADIYLDPVQFDDGEWQIEIKRGCAYDAASVSLGSYAGGAYQDWFAWKTGTEGKEAPRALAAIADRLGLLRVSSVTHESPVQAPGLAVIAIRAKGRQIEALSVKASGWVQDWDGTGWRQWVTTSNPAAHFRDILAGALNADPLPAALIDDEGLRAWRTACSAQGWTCDLIAEGAAIEQVLERIAGCGYARFRASERWGVVRDRDRSGEEPAQIFSARNSSKLTMTKAFSRLPDAFRAIWRDGEDLGRDREVLVFRKGREGVLRPRIEEIRYEGLISEASVRSRAEFDLRQGELRSAFWTFSAPAEAVRVERGDLVLVNHPVLSHVMSSARISQVLIEGGLVIGFETDAPLLTFSEDGIGAIPDMGGISDLLAAGQVTAVTIRQADGTLATHQLALSGNAKERGRIMLAAPVAAILIDDGSPAIRAGCLVQAGPAGEIARRLVVAGIEPGSDYTLTLTCVNEAPELWQ